MNGIEDFRNGIFELRTRRFGDVAEFMVEKIYDLKPSNAATHNRITENGERVEIAFGTALKKNDAVITSENVIDQCLKANISNRALDTNEIDSFGFTVNIQQLKPNNFDILYYGLFFKDKIRIYKASNNDVCKMPNYHSRQHRDNPCEGQFFITENNVRQHDKRFLDIELTYEELYSLLK